MEVVGYELLDREGEYVDPVGKVGPGCDLFQEADAMGRGENDRGGDQQKGGSIQDAQPGAGYKCKGEEEEPVAPGMDPVSIDIAQNAKKEMCSKGKPGAERLAEWIVL